MIRFPIFRLSIMLLSFAYADPANAEPVTARSDNKALDALLSEAHIQTFNALSELVAKRGCLSPDLSLAISPLRTRALACPVPHVFRLTDTHRFKRLIVVAECPSSGETIRLIAKARLRTRTPVPVKDVMPGTTLDAKDLEWRIREIDNIADTACTIDDIIGKSSSRRLVAGRPITLKWLSFPLLVRKGQSIHVLADVGNGAIRLSGVALNDGALNTIVVVRNPSTKKTFPARVIGEGTVSVTIDPPHSKAM